MCSKARVPPTPIDSNMEPKQPNFSVLHERTNEQNWKWKKRSKRLAFPVCLFLPLQHKRVEYYNSSRSVTKLCTFRFQTENKREWNSSTFFYLMNWRLISSPWIPFCAFATPAGQSFLSSNRKGVDETWVDADTDWPTARPMVGRGRLTSLPKMMMEVQKIRFFFFFFFLNRMGWRITTTATVFP